MRTSCLVLFFLLMFYSLRAQWITNTTGDGQSLTNPEYRHFTILNTSSATDPVKIYLSGNDYGRGLQLGRDDGNHKILITGDIDAYKSFRLTNLNYRHFSIINTNSATDPVKLYLSGNDFGRGLQIGRDDGNHKIILAGNVGIGTSNPGHKLSVNGTIGAKEVKVTSAGWPDFVFEPNYNLPTLQEVETYINQNGHLQDIPSAEEVKADGISLGEMDAKLLQKIEELTLYSIAQEKHFKQQSEHLSEQTLIIQNLLQVLENQNQRLITQEEEIQKLKDRINLNK